MTQPSSCLHNGSDLKLWRVWTTHFHSAPNDKSIVQIVLECKCGERINLESKIGEVQ